MAAINRKYICNVLYLNLFITQGQGQWLAYNYHLGHIGYLHVVGVQLYIVGTTCLISNVGMTEESKVVAIKRK